MVARAALLIVGDHLRRRAAHLDFRAHPLQARSKRFNLLLLVRGSRLEVLLQLRDGRFLFLHCAALFEELVEQHRIHSFVAHSVNFPLCVAGHQIRIHFFHFFGHEAELRDAVWIKLVLVAEGHRFQRKDRFARLVHRLDLVLETSGGDGRAELTVGSNDYSYSPRHSYPRDAGDKCFVCVPPVPMRMVLDSPATLGLPISMLLLPVVRFVPAATPSAMLLPPVALLNSAFTPVAVLSLPVELKTSALAPVAVLLLLVVLFSNA